MKYPNKEDINNLISNPEYYAENMSMTEIDHVIFGFIITRNEIQRRSK